MSMSDIRVRDIIEPKALLCSPDHANDVTITGHATANTVGSYATISADIGSSDVFLHSITVTGITGIHQIDIAVGAASSEVDYLTIGVASTGQYVIDSAQIPANSRISARTSSKAGGGQTVSLFLHYKQLP